LETPISRERRHPRDQKNHDRKMAKLKKKGVGRKRKKCEGTDTNLGKLAKRQQKGEEENTRQRWGERKGASSEASGSIKGGARDAGKG